MILRVTLSDKFQVTRTVDTYRRYISTIRIIEEESLYFIKTIAPATFGSKGRDWGMIREPLGCYLAGACLLLTSLLGSMSVEVRASYDSPRMELDGNVQWQESAGNNNDGQFTLNLVAEYIPEGTGGVVTRLPFAALEVRKASDNSILVSTFFTADGDKTVSVNCPQGGSITIYILVFMKDGRPNTACGAVKNEDGDIYYGRTENKVCYDSTDYGYSIRFKDSGDSGSSFVGAAAIYKTMCVCKKFMEEEASESGNMNVEVWWPTDGDSDFSPGSGQSPSIIYLGSSRFEDDGTDDEWSLSFDDIRHQYGHAVHYELGYKRGFWPEGSPDDHDWDLEMTTSDDGDEEEWAFVEGFAHAFAALVDVSSTGAHNDFYYIDGKPDGFHIEDYEFDGLIFEHGENAGVRGERTEGCIACLLYDVVDDYTYVDNHQNEDDEAAGGVPGPFERLWDAMVMVGPAQGSIVNNILEFWDKYHIVHDECQHKLEYVFVKNNVARYSYGEYIGQSEDGPDGLQVYRFEVRGMNTASRPTEDQYVLVRFVLNNTSPGMITFDNNNGVCYRMVGPQNPNGVNGGGSLLGESLMPETKVLSTDIRELLPGGQGSYSFWPHYVLSDQTAGPDNWHDIDLTCYDEVIWSDDFEDGIDGGWTVGWTAGKTGCTWYGVSWDGGNRAWCAGILDGNPRNPQTNNYVNDMEAYMYRQGDYRLMNLMISFDYYLRLYKDDADLVKIQYYTVIDGNSYWVNIKVYDWENNVSEWTHQSLHIPAVAFESEDTDIKIRFLFFSNNVPGTTEKGTFIDNVELVSGGG